MIFPKVTLGDISKKASCLFLQGKGNPGIIIVPKKTSFSLWSIRTSSLIAVLGGKSKLVKDMTVAKISKNSESKEIFVIIGFQCGMVQLWKLNLTQISAICIFFKGHEKEVCCLSKRLENSCFISGCEKGDIVNWDITRKKGIFRIRSAHKNGIICIKLIQFFEQKRSAILSCGKDSLIKFWDLRTGKCLRVFELNYRYIFSTGFFNESKLLLISAENEKIPIFLISDYLDFYKIGQIHRFFRTKKQFLKIYYAEPSVFLFNQKGNIEITILSSMNNFCQTRDVIEKKWLEKISDLKIPIIFSLEKEIRNIDLWQKSKNGKVLCLVHFSKTDFLEILEFTSGGNNKEKKIFSLVKIFKFKLHSHKGGVRGVLWFSRDNFIISLEGSSKRIQIWYWTTQIRTNFFKTYSKGLCLGFCGPNTVAIGGKTGNIEVYDLSSKILLLSKKEAHVGPVWTLDTVNNFLLMCTGGSDGVLKFWEFETKRISLNKKILIKDQILGVKIISSKNLVIVCGISSKILIFFLKTLQFSFSLLGHCLPVIALSLSDDVDIFGTGSADFSVKIWNLNEKKEIKTLIADNNAITAFEFQRYSKNFFSGSRNGRIKYWNGNIFSLICEISHFHSGPIWVLRSSENGKYLASGSQDKMVTVWEIQKKKKGKISKKFSLETKGPNKKRKLGIIKRIIYEKQKKKNGDILSTDSSLNRFFFFFRSFSGEELSELLDSLKKKELNFLLNEILAESVHNLIITPLLISTQLILIIKHGKKINKNFKKDSPFEIFRRKLKRIIKTQIIQGKIVIEKVKKFGFNYNTKVSDLPDSN